MYQTKRLYAKMALGKAGHMDVPDSDSNTPNFELTANFSVVVVLLLLVQLIQFAFSLEMLRKAGFEDVQDWQVGVNGFVFLLIAIVRVGLSVLTA